MSNDLISRSALLAAYDKAHQGPPGGARKLIEDAPEALVRNKGLIVLGYPGIGKSSCGGTDGCVDLESSYFDRNESYCQVAESIADQGYTVFVSTHPNVVEYFSNKTWFLPNVARAVIFCPQKTMKKEWIKRLHERWISTGTGKDLRALRRAENFFIEDIDSLFRADLPVYQPDAIDYDLKNYICKMRKDWCEMEEQTNDLQRLSMENRTE